ncbi:copper-binding protein [Franconibacter pulveris]|uniref:copper-binding protein n=1 Tax=Franconibacter pulveris TaxID=435910 RepID=UPI0004955F57|nr:copper-binding protein [Franconibacter pulveris]HBI09790.1 copper-binding protein [Franconibacter pulveris]
MSRLLLCVLLAAVAALTSFSAFTASHHHDMHQMAPADAPVYASQGIVKKADAQGVAIAHQAIPALNWPPMTMTFAQPTTPVALKPGDAVAFTFRQTAEGYQLISATPAK